MNGDSTGLAVVGGWGVWDGEEGWQKARDTGDWTPQGRGDGTQG